MRLEQFVAERGNTMSIQPKNRSEMCAFQYLKKRKKKQTLHFFPFTKMKLEM